MTMDTAPLKAAVGDAIDAFFASSPDVVTSPPPAAPPPPLVSPPPPPPATPAIITGLPFGFTPLYENGIRTDVSADLNTGRLNDLLASLSEGPGGGREGGGMIRMTEPGAIPLNGQVTLMPDVSIRRESASRWAWAGQNGGYIFTSRPTDVLTDLDLDLYVDEGADFAGVVIRLHSHQGIRGRFVGFGRGQESTFGYPSATSTAGEPPGGGRNCVFNDITWEHRGMCGVGLLTDGLAKGFGDQAQVVTDSDFRVKFANCYKYGVRLDTWTDTIHFVGMTYMAMTGPNSVGFINNPQDPDNVWAGVYNISFDKMAVDTFPGDQNLHRYGVALCAGKHFKCGSYMNLPAAENGSFSARPSCLSYDWDGVTGADNSLQHIHHDVMDVAR